MARMTARRWLTTILRLQEAKELIAAASKGKQILQVQLPAQPTHLELTMVHEAMTLENSGRNLALVEYAHYLKMAILLGLSGQCFLHAMPWIWHARAWAQAGASPYGGCIREH